VRETEILVEQQPPQGVLVCDHAGLVIDKFYNQESLEDGAVRGTGAAAGQDGRSEGQSAAGSEKGKGGKGMRVRSSILLRPFEWLVRALSWVLNKVTFFFFFTLFTGPRRSLSLKLSGTKVYQPQLRARLDTTAHLRLPAPLVHSLGLAEFGGLTSGGPWEPSNHHRAPHC